MHTDIAGLRRLIYRLVQVAPAVLRTSETPSSNVVRSQERGLRPIHHRARSASDVGPEAKTPVWEVDQGRSGLISNHQQPPAGVSSGKGFWNAQKPERLSCLLGRRRSSIHSSPERGRRRRTHPSDEGEGSEDRRLGGLLCLESTANGQAPAADEIGRVGPVLV